MTGIELLSVVALLEDLPESGLVRGQVGTVVESWAPGVYEVEFSDDNGRTYAMVAIEGGATNAIAPRTRPPSCLATDPSSTRRKRRRPRLLHITHEVPYNMSYCSESRVVCLPEAQLA